MEFDVEGQGSEDGRRESGVDLQHYWAVVKKRRWTIIATTAIVTALAIVITMRKPKIYAATTTVIVNPNAPNVLGRANTGEVVSLGAGGGWLNTDYYNTQKDIITSRQVARLTVDKHNLWKDPRLVPPAPGLSEDQMKDIATGGVQGRISVQIAAESRVVAITVRDTDPQLAADLSNWVSDVYVERNVVTKQDVTRDATGSVAKLLDEGKADLEKAERALYAFKEDNGILSVSLEDSQNQIAKKLRNAADALAESDKGLKELRARRAAIQDLLNAHIMPAGPLTEWPAIERLRERVDEEGRALRGLELRYGPKHEAVIDQSSKLGLAQKELDIEVKTMLANLDKQIGKLERVQREWGSDNAQFMKEAFALNKLEEKYKPLVRQAEIASQNYTELLRRLKENTIQEKDAANNMSLLDAALVPSSPVEPNVPQAAMLGFGLGVLLAFALAFFFEFLDRSVKSQEDIERVVGLPFLGLIPAVDPAMAAKGEIPDMYVHRNPSSTIAECCRVVRTNLLFCSPDKPLKTLVVTSSNPVEGKTTNVINMGIVMAQGGHRTLIVDTDMRRPRMHKALGVSNENGISRLILGETEIADAVKSTDVPNLYVLPCGPLPPNPAELLQTEKFAAVARRLSEKFDRVIFDSPPVLAVTDAAVMSRVSDGVVVVVRAGRTTRDAMRRAKHALTAVKSPIAGVILNDVNLRSPHYASYYNYYYASRIYHNNTTAPAEGKGNS